MCIRDREYAAGQGCALTLCTRGESGAWLADGKEVYRQRPYLVEARDTMAAGDSFLTCFLVNYLNESQKNPGGHEAEMCIRDRKGIAFYHRVIDALLDNGIEPILCLNHFDMPMYWMEKGGFCLLYTS